MRKIATLDCETDPFKRGRIPQPFIWGFYDGEEFFQHESLEVVLREITHRKLIVYAHNGGKFDYHYMFEHMEPYDDIMIINGRIAKFKIGEAEFRDSFNIIPTALKAFKKDDFDYSLLEKDIRYKSENWKKIVKYLESDCVNLYNYVSEFLDRYGSNLTVAGTAMKQWKKISGIEPPRSSRTYYDEMSKFYYGGRVQCFKHGIIDERFNVIDINSAYPRAMMDKHPIGLNYTVVSGDVENENYGACFFVVEGIAHGCFPFRNEKKALLFPNDGVNREYFVTGWELIAARETGMFNGIVKQSYVYTELMDFADYITHFFNERLASKAAGDTAGDIFNKLLMNSLYGKFGSDPSDYANFVIVPNDEIQTIKSSGYDFSGELGSWLLASKTLEDSEMRFYNVATAASITGWVRAYLFKSICQCGIDNVLYCDTDSIATLKIGEQLSIGKELGQWKDEGEYDKAGIGGKKLYIFRGVLTDGKRDYKIASKGARLTQNQLWKIAAGGQVLYKPENPSYSVHNGIKFVNRNIRQTF